MLEVKNPDLSVEELMNKIKAELAASKGGRAPADARRRERSHPELASRQFGGGLAGLRSTDDQSIEFRDRYTLAELLESQDELFVRNAYRAVLQREPEPGGAESYLRQLREGTLSKVELIGVLRYSGEGKNQAVQVEGLRSRLFVKRLFRLPVIGYVVRWVTAWARLPLFLRNFEQLHAAVHHRRAEIRQAIGSLERKTVALAEAKRAAEERAQAAERRLDAIEKMLNAINGQTQDVARLAAQLSASKEDKVDNTGLDPFLIINSEDSETKSKRHIQKWQSEGSDRDVFYSAFQDTFYNSDVVRNKQPKYLPFIDRQVAAAFPFLDCGCGRGEFLKALREAEIAAVGIDTNRYEVDILVRDGLDVREADILSYLQSSESSYSGISALQVVEHLSADYLETFLKTAIEKLAPGGVLILETVNPHSPYALSNFYQDPTHIKPLPPELLKFMVEWHELRGVKLVYSSLVPAVDRSFRDKRMNYQDYAVLGYKR